MSSSSAFKQNPFQRSNPFQVQQSAYVQSTQGYVPFQQKPTFPSYPHHDSFQQKQNTFQPRLAEQMWKFHQDNCKKVNVFNAQSYSRVGDKLLCERNSFQKQLVLSNVTKKNNNNSGQQVGVEKIQNPFARKYLLGGGKLVESQVYVSQQEHNTNFDRYKLSYQQKPTQHDSYKYNNFITPMPSTPQSYYNMSNNTSNNPTVNVVGSSKNLQTSLHYKNDNVYNNQYGSRKSIQRDEHYNSRLNNGSFSNIPNPVTESRYSIEREKEKSYNHVGSSQHIYPQQQSSNKYLSLSRGGSRAERDDGMMGMGKNGERESGSRVKFDDSDEERQGNSRYYERGLEERAPRFGSGKQLSQPLKGPECFEVHGLKFYKQSVQCY